MRRRWLDRLTVDLQGGAEVPSALEVLDDAVVLVVVRTRHPRLRRIVVA